MAQNKTTENDNSVSNYLLAIKDEKKRKDCVAIVELIQKQTKLPPKMWGVGIVGFGSYHYKYESGHEGDAPAMAFAARANSITLYVKLNAEQRETLLVQLGKHKTDKGCIHIKKMEDIDTDILSKIIKVTIENVSSEYPA